MYLSLNKAAKEAGISKSTLSNALNNGRLTANKDERGRWQIDPAALFQVFPKTTPNEQSVPTPNTVANIDLRIEIAELKASLNAERRITDQMADDIADLRTRLDKADARSDKKDAILEDLRAKQDQTKEIEVAPIQQPTPPEQVGQGGKRGFLGLFSRA